MSMEASEICITAEALDREQEHEFMFDHIRVPRNTMLDTATIAIHLPTQVHSLPRVTSTSKNIIMYVCNNPAATLYSLFRGGGERARIACGKREVVECSRWLHLERLLDPSTTMRCELAGGPPKGPPKGTQRGPQVF